MEAKIGDLNSWDDFKGNWLKAYQIKDFGHVFTVLNVESDKNPDEKDQVVLTIEVYGRKKKLSLNQANIKACEERGIISPLLLRNKKLKFGKMKVYSPSEKKQVDSLIIEKIE